MPNPVVRSSLFAPIARGRRKDHKETLIAGRGDAQITVTGPQLDMSDSDVFMHCLELSKREELGKPVYFTRNDFLNGLGKKGPHGKSSYEWLHGALWRLKITTIKIKTERYETALNLIQDYEANSESGEYWIAINPRIATLFGGGQFTKIDWQKRQAIAHQIDLAKWVQGYILSNRSGEQTISVSYLQEWSGQGHRRKDHFAKALHEAMTELQRLDVIKSFCFDGEKLTFYR